MELACTAAHGQPLATMADAIAHAWTDAKFRSLDASIALYSVSDDIEGRTIAQTLRTRVTTAMAAAFRTAPDGAHFSSAQGPNPQPELVAATLLGALSGISRDLLETTASHPGRLHIGNQLTRLVRAYLTAAPTEPLSRPQTQPIPTLGRSNQHAASAK